MFEGLREAARALRRTPWVSAVAVVVLSLALGANAAVFSVLYGFLLRPLPLREPDRLVFLFETRANTIEPYTSHMSYVEWQTATEAFGSMSAATTRRFDVITAGVAESLLAEIVTVDFLETVGVGPYAGRGFREREEEPVCLISHRWWERRFGSDPGIIGTTLRIGELYPTIIGILPEVRLSSSGPVPSYSFRLSPQPSVQCVGPPCSLPHAFWFMIDRTQPWETPHGTPPGRVSQRGT